MELELCLHPDDAARLPRLKRLASLKSGKTRSRPVRIVWHDSAERELAQQGLALAEHRSQWELRPLQPNSKNWPPGGPAPVLASARTTDQLGRTLPDRLVPVAALEGRASALSLLTEQGPVGLTLLNGEVRSAIGQHRVNRLSLQGGAEPVRTLALALASDLRLAVPPHSLAAEAFAIATGVTPPPHREGPPELPEDLSVAEAFAHVAGHLADAIVQLAPDAAHPGAGPEPVHQMRVAVRRLRSATRVFRRALAAPEIGEADKALKALAAKLAPTRDWDVFVTETAAAAMAAFPAEKRLQRLLAAAERQRRACRKELRHYLAGADFRHLGILLACLASAPHTATPDAAEPPTSPLREFAAQVLGKRYRHLARIDNQLADLEPAALHAIRLQAKRLRYTAEIFAPIYPGKPAHRFIRRLSRLQDRLGALNDAAVCQHLMGELSNGNHAFASGLVLGFVGARGRKTRRQIDRAWTRFHRLEPFWA
jgi:CHAD domain-containing protein